MKARSAHICLVGAGQLSTTPRLVKEADALVEAGYRVTTVTTRFLDWACEADREFDGRAWTRLQVAYGRHAGVLRWGYRRLQQRVSQAVAGTLGGKVLEGGFHAAVGALGDCASGVDADLYIGHGGIAGLIAAGRAAQKRQRRLGFDAEDDHLAEVESGPMGDRERAVRKDILLRWLRHCTHLTTAAPLMARSLQESLGHEFAVVLNVFPLVPGRGANEPEAGTVYWFSQTVGAGRGIEEFLALLPHVSKPIRLFLRGRVDARFETELRALLRKLGIPEASVVLQPPIPPGELQESCFGHSLGLSLELSRNANRDICLPNKIFQYLIAGVPVALSSTRAQTQIAAELGLAALLLDFQDPLASAGLLDSWLSDLDRQRAARQHACELARDRYCWEVEQYRFLESVERCLQTGVNWS